MLWVSINEPLAFGAMEVRTGAIKPDQFNGFLDRVADAHRAVYRAAHEADPEAKVTTNEAYIPPDVLAQFAGFGVKGIEGSFFDRVAGSLDYLGFDYYTGTAADNPASAQSMATAGTSNFSPKTSTTCHGITHSATRDCRSTSSRTGW